jgi:hypothetical protein
MKYMGWSYDQLMLCPEGYLRCIVEYAEGERREAEDAQRRAERTH